MKMLVGLSSHIWIHSLWCRLPQIYISYLEPIIIFKKEGGGEKPVSDTMDGTFSLTGYPEGIFLTYSSTDTMN